MWHKIIHLIILIPVWRGEGHMGMTRRKSKPGFLISERTRNSSNAVDYLIVSIVENGILLIKCIREWPRCGIRERRGGRTIWKRGELYAKITKRELALQSNGMIRSKSCRTVRPTSLYIQVFPIRIYFFDHVDFPLPFPSFDLFLCFNCWDHSLMIFVPDKDIGVIFIWKTGNLIFPVLSYSLWKIWSYSYI